MFFLKKSEEKSNIDRSFFKSPWCIARRYSLTYTPCRCLVSLLPQVLVIEAALYILATAFSWTDLIHHTVSYIKVTWQISFYNKNRHWGLIYHPAGQTKTQQLAETDKLGCFISFSLFLPYEVSCKSHLTLNISIVPLPPPHYRFWISV